MGKILELSDDTYQQLVDLAQQQQRTPEEMLRVCLATDASPCTSLRGASPTGILP